MANDVNKQVIELNEVTEENRNRATRSVKSETQLSDGRTRLYRLAAVCFGVLCVLQVILNISLRLAFSGSNAERDQLQKERDKCRKNMNQIEMERGLLLKGRDQSDTSSGIIILCTDRDQLQEEIDQCRKNMNQLERERGQLLRDRNQSENTEDKNQLQERYNALTKDRDMLRNRVSVLTNENVALEKRLSECGINICRKIRKTCPEGWRLWGSSCYFLSSEMKTWEESRLYCLRRGAYLVIINSKEEHEFLFGLIKGAWIGLTDIVTEGTWKWVDGTPLTTPRYWSRGEPNGGGVENCVVVTYRSSGQGEWWDYQCSNLEYWICEKGSL